MLGYIIILFITATITLILSLYTYQYRSNHNAASLLVYLFLGISIYSSAYAMELLVNDLQDMMLCSHLEYIGISSMPVLWFLIAASYSEFDRYLSRPIKGTLFLIPLLTLLFHFTSNYHNFFYASVTIINKSNYTLMATEPGPWYYVHVVYLMVLMFISTIMLITKWYKDRKPYRSQTISLLVASMIPWAGMVFYHLFREKWPLDTVPLFFAIASLIFLWSARQYRLFDLVPVAREQVIDSMRDGVMVFDNRNRLLDFNRAAASVFSSLNSQDIGKRASEIFGSFPELLSQLSKGSGEYELFIDESGSYHTYSCRVFPITNSYGQLIAKALSIIDVTVQAQMMSELRRLATIDSLTEASSRRHFMEQSSLSIKQAKIKEQQVALILLDIDHFKQVNDTFGHQVGDCTLKAITEICRDNIRPDDLLGRYGGEEFMILLMDTSLDEATLVAERIRCKVATTPIKINDNLISVTASMGVAVTDSVSEADIEALLRKADQALYKAKAAGRNTVIQASSD
ncbi:MAG: diguanylate cyclase [Syntrophomonadaceae bacterium]|nr:diguanylate cyclase [Syntrophomonadaceae bacterium]